MIEAIRVRARERNITRLCHFTPSRNLGHIATDLTGVLSAAGLEADERRVFNPTDRERLDGCPDHVSCSIQYPNAWYFRAARGKERLFRDWVVLLIHPHYLWARGTKFCPRNAAAGSGEDVAEGVAAFESLYAPEVQGGDGRTYRRLPARPSWLPTDEQAEVLIPDQVDSRDLLGVVVADEAQGRLEVARIAHLGVDVPTIYMAPDFFDPYRLSTGIRNGEVPEEVLLRRDEA